MEADLALTAARSRPRSHRMSVDLTLAAAAADLSDSDEEDAAGDAPPADSPSKLGSKRPSRREPPPPRSPPPPRPPPLPAGRDAGTTAVAEAAVEVRAPRHVSPVPSTCHLSLPRVTHNFHVASRVLARLEIARAIYECNQRVITVPSNRNQTVIRCARG